MTEPSTPNNNSKSPIDIFGVAPYGETLKIAVEKSLEGAISFLSKICSPAAEELGLMLKDKVRVWRLNNIVRTIEKSKGKISFSDNQIQLNAHPRVVHEIIENASWCDNDVLQEMWAGMIASSCDNNQGDDKNLIFVTTLKQLTVNQAKILNHICINCQKEVDINGFIAAEHIEMTISQLSIIVDTMDVHMLDAEINKLSALDLLGGTVGTGALLLQSAHTRGFELGSEPLTAYLEPTSFALNLYAKAQGFKGSASEYFNLKYLPK